MSFVHLHNHSGFSIRDGFCTTEDYVKTAQSLGMPAIAITDHGNIHGAISLSKAAKSAKINGIIGIEMYVSAEDCRIKTNDNKTNYHITLLAKNEGGYKNICNILTEAWERGYYYVPRVDKTILSKYNKGIIALSGCLKGEVAQSIMHNLDEEVTSNLLKQYKEIYGDDFSIEIMENGYEAQGKVNKFLIDFAATNKYNMVATNDCHYITKSQSMPQEIMQCIGMKQTYEARKFKGTGELYLKSEEEMKAAFSRHGDIAKQMIENSNKIASSCDFSFSFKGYRMPKFDGLDDKAASKKLRELCREGWKKKIAPVILKQEEIDKYKERIEYELKTIEDLGFCHYFLMVWDVGKYCDDNNIMRSPGRGSVGGSLASYLLNISDIDPIKYELLFERFLNPGRTGGVGGGLPDIDVDIISTRRDEVISYLRKRWGEDKVSQVATFGTMATRTTLKNVGKALGHEFTLMNNITSIVPKRVDCTLSDFLNGNQEKGIEPVPELKKYAEVYPELFSISMELEGAINSVGKHASAIVISDRPILNDTPLFLGDPDDKSSIICAFDMHGVESLGLVKMDFLGLTELSIIDHIVRDVKKVHNKDIDIAKISLDDKNTWETFCKGDTFGVFQFSSQLMREGILQKVRPNNLIELAACNAICRPGNLDAGTHTNFINRKHGLELVSYIHPKLEPILRSTYGVLVYQEQSMRIVRDLAGFTLAEADILRKGMGKKKSKLFETLTEKFFAGAAKNNVDIEIAKELWTLINYMARYSFNASHAVGYSLLAYRTAYLKTHYPMQYYWAMLKHEHNNEDTISEIVRECRLRGVTILPPDLMFDPSTRKENEIMLPFVAAKTMGELPNRHLWERMPFKNLLDFFSRIDYKIINERALTSLIACGAFETMTTMREEIMTLYRKNRQRREKVVTTQSSLFGTDVTTTENNEGSALTSLDEKVRAKYEALGFNLRYSLLKNYSDYIEKYEHITPTELLAKKHADLEGVVSVCGVMSDLRTHVDKRGKEMIFFKLKDEYSSVNSLMFASAYEGFADMGLHNNDVIKVQGRFDNRKNLIVSDIVRARKNKVVVSAI